MITEDSLNACCALVKLSTTGGGTRDPNFPDGLFYLQSGCANDTLSQYLPESYSKAEFSADDFKNWYQDLAIFSILRKVY